VIGVAKSRWWQKHLSAEQEASGVDDQPAHQPGDVIEQEIDDRADGAVRGVDTIALDIGCVPQHD